MIKATELRIWNYIGRWDIGDGEYRIESIIELRAKATTSGPVKVIYEYQDLEPISITPEILEKCGFSKSNIIHNIEKSIKISVSLSSYSDTIVFVGNSMSTSGMEVKGIEYLHQLQNLYFALTGDELKVAW